MVVLCLKIDDESGLFGPLSKKVMGNHNKLLYNTTCPMYNNI